jgi:DNA-binding protein HU-beta
MNKGELIERLSGKLGDHKTSSKAVDAVISEIETAVSSGEKVNISGFGVFEKRERAARNGRNPRTGEPIRVQKTTVPAFRPGASFKTLVSGGSSARSSSGRAQARSGGQQSVSARAQGSQSRGQFQAQGQRAQPRGQAQRRGQQTAYAQNSAVTVRKPASRGRGH